MDGERRSPDYLLRGGRLDAVAAWAATTTMGLRPAELRFLDASLARAPPSSGNVTRRSSARWRPSAGPAAAAGSSSSPAP